MTIERDLQRAIDDAEVMLRIVMNRPARIYKEGEAGKNKEMRWYQQKLRMAKQALRDHLKSK